MSEPNYVQLFDFIIKDKRSYYMLYIHDYVNNKIINIAKITHSIPAMLCIYKLESKKDIAPFSSIGPCRWILFANFEYK